MVADYIKETGNHVLYRVTPVFNGNNLVASGVQMEAMSVEDKGAGISFNVFVIMYSRAWKLTMQTAKANWQKGSKRQKLPAISQKYAQLPMITQYKAMC